MQYEKVQLILWQGARKKPPYRQAKQSYKPGKRKQPPYKLRFYWEKGKNAEEQTKNKPTKGAFSVPCLPIESSQIQKYDIELIITKTPINGHR